ncbi:MAG: response regulator transcription factor [Bacteroidales bacterium]|nr:response regulator transcription factor [Bacteroidales bacterium]
MNCIIIDDDDLSRKIVEEFVKKTEFLNLISSFSNAVDAMCVFNGPEPIDLIFLDVEMPEMTGLEFLKSIENSPQIIIISGQEKYALEAFEYNVVDYLLKPISLARYYKSVNKVHKRYNETSKISGTREEIFIKKKNSTLVRLKYDDILWVEALENYVIVNTYNQKFTIHFTMKAITNKLPNQKFKRVHRSYIVNVNKIDVIEDNTVIIKSEIGNKVIPIGKSYKDNLMNYLNLISK